MVSPIANAARLKWARVMPEGPRVVERIMQRHRAAELATELVYQFAGPGAVQPRTDLYLVDSDTPRISWESACRTFWVVVERLGE